MTEIELLLERLHEHERFINQCMEIVGKGTSWRFDTCYSVASRCVEDAIDWVHNPEKNWLKLDLKGIERYATQFIDDYFYDCYKKAQAAKHPSLFK